MRVRTRTLVGSLVGLALLGLWAGRGVAQANPGIRIHMHGVEGYAADGLLYAPAVTEKGAALILVPDDSGITPVAAEAAARFSGAGFSVVVVDLDRGLPPEAAAHPREQIDHDLDAALAFVCAQVKDSNAVGLLGWGSGGAAALRLAARANLPAVAIENVATTQVYDHAEAVRAAVLASFTDPAGHASAAQKAIARLHALSQSVSAKTYATAEATGPEESTLFNAQDLEDVRARELRFFDARLVVHRKPQG